MKNGSSSSGGNRNGSNIAMKAASFRGGVLLHRTVGGGSGEEGQKTNNPSN